MFNYKITIANINTIVYLQKLSTILLTVSEMKNISDLIVKILKDKNITNVEFANKLNISPQNLNNYLKVEDWKVSKLVEACKILNIPIYEFIDFDDSYQDLFTEKYIPDPFTALKSKFTNLEEKIKYLEEEIKALKAQKKQLK